MLGEEPEPTPRSGAQWAAIVLGSVGATTLTLLLAMLIANLGFEYRRGSSHEGRLERLVEKRPGLEQVREGLAAEGAREVASAGDAVALARLAEAWAGAQSGEVLEKGTRWASTRAFLTGDFVYILYFDGERLLQDFTCVRRAGDRGTPRSGLPRREPIDRDAIREPLRERGARAGDAVPVRGVSAHPGVGRVCEDARAPARSSRKGAWPASREEVAAGWL